MGDVVWGRGAGHGVWGGTPRPAPHNKTNIL